MVECRDIAHGLLQALDTDALPAPRRYSSPLAARALRRAARLQVEAAERAERSAPATTARAEPEGYAHDQLVAAAAGAGIDQTYLHAALSELDDADPTTALSRIDEAREQAATLWLGTRQRSVLVSRMVEGTPDEVWDAIGSVFEARSVGLQLERLADGHPARGGVAYYSMKSLRQLLDERSSVSGLCFGMDHLGVRQVAARLHDHGGHTQVTLYGDLHDGVKAQVTGAHYIAAFLGLFMAASGATFGGAVFGVVGLLGFGLLGMIAGVLAAMASRRSAYRAAIVKLERLLGGLLENVSSRRQSYVAYQPQREAIAQRLAASSWVPST